MGIMAYRRCIEKTREKAIEAFSKKNMIDEKIFQKFEKWDRKLIPKQDDYIYAAIDGNILYYTLLQRRIIEKTYSENFDFILRNLKLSYDGNRFRVFQDREDYDSMKEAGFYDELTSEDDYIKRINYFISTRTTAINEMNSPSNNFFNTIRIFDNTKEKVTTDGYLKNRIIKMIDDITLDDVFSTSCKKFYSESSTRSSIDNNDGLAALVNALSICGEVEENIKKYNIDVSKIGLSPGTMHNEMNDEHVSKYVELPTNDVLNDLQLFGTEYSILIDSVNEFCLYLAKLEKNGIMPLIVWDQSVFSTYTGETALINDLNVPSTKLRNINRVYKTNCEPCRYFMVLLAIELIKKNYTNLVAIGEGELYCTHLQKQGIVDVVISTDSDALAAGAKMVDPDNLTYRDVYEYLGGLFDVRVITLYNTIIVPFVLGYDFHEANLYKYGETRLINTLINYQNHINNIKIRKINKLEINKYDTDLYNKICNSEVSDESETFYTELAIDFLLNYIQKEYPNIEIPADYEEQFKNLEFFYRLQVLKYTVELPIDIPVYVDTQVASSILCNNSRLIYTKRMFKFINSISNLNDSENGQHLTYYINNSLTYAVFRKLFTQTKFNLQRINFKRNSDTSLNVLSNIDMSYLSLRYINSKDKNKYIYSQLLANNTDKNINIGCLTLLLFSKYIYYHMIYDNNISIEYIFTKFIEYLNSPKYENIKQLICKTSFDTGIASINDMFNENFINIVNNAIIEKYNKISVPEDQNKIMNFTNISYNLISSNIVNNNIRDTLFSIFYDAPNYINKLNSSPALFKTNIIVIFHILFAMRFNPYIGVCFINLINIIFHLSLYDPAIYDNRCDSNFYNIYYDYEYKIPKEIINEFILKKIISAKPETMRKIYLSIKNNVDNLYVKYNTQNNDVLNIS